MYAKYFKRLIDFTLALIALIVLSPILLIVAVLVRTKLGSPIIFKQERVGKDSKIFKMYKFRSMTNAKDVNGELLPNELRMTSFGKFIRKLSLDELPELLNVLKGDMSIIGPRPLMVRYLPYYSKEELKRHNVKPGLTGLAQINGRSFITWEEIFKYDIEYVSDISFFNDLDIFLKTIKKVFKQNDIVDFSEVIRDKNGKLYATVNGKLFRIHEALDVERKDNGL